MDEILEIVERAINIAELVKNREPDRLHVALASLSELAVELGNNAPGHPALDKLNQYIEALRE